MSEIDTYQKGKFKLEEWEDVNYCEHDFYKNDEGLTDKEIVDLLNEQEERIKELQQTIDTIAKDYEYSHGMDIRNAEWFTAW